MDFIRAWNEVYWRVFLFFIVLPLWVGAQSKSAWRLETIPSVVKSSGFPLLTRTGECVARRSASGLTLLDSEGKETTKINGKFLKHWVSSNGHAIAVLEKATTAKDGNNESTLILRWFDRDGRQVGSHNFSQHS